MSAVAAVGLTAGLACGETTAEREHREIRELNARITQLEIEEQQSQADFDAVVDAVMDDADGRVLMDGGGGFAGPQPEFIQLSDPTGAYTIRPFALIVFRHQINFTDDESAPEGRVAEGFEVKRFEFGAKGNVFSPDTTYYFDFSTSNGDIVLQYAWLEHQVFEGVTIGGGQFADFESYEQGISNYKVLFGQRTLANRVIGLEAKRIMQGVYAEYETDNVRVAGAFTDGFGSRGTEYSDGGVSIYGMPTEMNYGLNARADVSVLGTVADARKGFSSRVVDEDTLRFGGGVSYNEFGNGAATLDGSVTFFSVDASFQSPTGFALYLAFIANCLNMRDGDDAFNWGIVAQGSVELTPDVELVGRANWVFLDDDVFGADDFFSEYSLGLNYYIGGYSRLSTEISFAPQGVPSSGSYGTLGYQPSQEFQTVVRTQYQLLFGK